MSKEKTRYVYRDAESGEFVSEEYAAENPKTTVRDKILLPASEEEDTAE